MARSSGTIGKTAESKARIAAATEANALFAGLSEEQRSDVIDAMFEVATTSGPAEVFNLSPCVHKVVGYPLPVPDWQSYDPYLSLELVQEAMDCPRSRHPSHLLVRHLQKV